MVKTFTFLYFPDIHIEIYFYTCTFLYVHVFTWSPTITFRKSSTKTSITLFFHSVVFFLFTCLQNLSNSLMALERLRLSFCSISGNATIKSPKHKISGKKCSFRISHSSSILRCPVVKLNMLFTQRNVVSCSQLYLCSITFQGSREGNHIRRERHSVTAAQLQLGKTLTRDAWKTSINLISTDHLQ